MAAPFVQGKLWEREVRAAIETACAHCGAALTMEVDSAGRTVNVTAGSDPLVFTPDVDWRSFTEPNIIHRY